MLVDFPEWRADILEEHAEELGFLWQRRLSAVRSERADALALSRIDARIAAHADALVLAEYQGQKWVAPLLGSGEAAGAAAAAMVMAADATAHPALVSALCGAPAAVRAGGLAALCLVAAAPLRQAFYAEALRSGPLVGAAAALLGAAFHEAPAAEAQPAWRRHDDPEVRRLAWQVEARASRALGRFRAAPSDYRHALADADSATRDEALVAAARTGQTWLLSHLASARPVAEQREALRLLALLGGVEHAPLIIAAAREPALGLARFGLLAACGRACAVEVLLEFMHDGAEVEAALAGRAFTRITGVDVARPERIPLVARGQEPDDFSEDIPRCDAALAEKAWAALRPQLGDRRWAGGGAVEPASAASLPMALDLELRWGVQLRAAFESPAEHAPFDDERFPFE